MDAGKPETVLIIEDEQKISDIVTMYLQREGFKTKVADTGEKALHLIHEPFDLIVLDLMLPDIQGEELCKIIRERSDAPIIMLTAKSGEEDRIRGLGIGADDYVVKPFSPRELVARVKAILRRGRFQTVKDKTFLSSEGLVLDQEKHEATLYGRLVDLTPHEFNLLHTLMAFPGKAFTRDELLTHLYPRHEANVIDRVVDVHIGKLRQKIEKDPSDPKYILTERGVGYRFADSPDDSE